MAMVFGGSGYLAVFIAGLLFHAPHHISETEKFFNDHVIEGYAKPTIFLFLGALAGADFSGLVKYAPIGLILAAVFILIIRPIAVLLSIGWYTKLGKERLTWKELIFIASVRETGVIPAVLIVGIASLKIPGTEALAPIATWIILPSLIVMPLLKPRLAKKLDLLAEPVETQTSSDTNLIPEAVPAS
jgi:cell volume regulation protein A